VWCQSPGLDSPRTLRKELPIKRLLFCAVAASNALAFAGGPFGIDHRVTYDNDGIIQRGAQLAIEDVTIAAVVGGALWLGGEDRLGKTYWKTIDSMALGAISSTVLKEATTRSRPMQSEDPNLWFQGKGHYSFPSGEVTAMTAAVTPFMLEYGRENPAVYGLAMLPLYDAVARVKVQGHWQSDVIAGAALGFATGYIGHQQENPFILRALPHGFAVGFGKRF
jgi:membrane-associated phospholipid phosphatase